VWVYTHNSASGSVGGEHILGSNYQVHLHRSPVSRSSAFHGHEAINDGQHRADDGVYVNYDFADSAGVVLGFELVGEQPECLKQEKGES